MLKKIAIFMPSRCSHVTDELETTGTGAREQIADWLANQLAPKNEVHVFTNQEYSVHKPNLHYVTQEMAAPMLTTYQWDALVTFDFPSIATLPDIKDTVKRIIVSQNYFEIPPEGYTPEVFDLIDAWVYPSQFALDNCSRVNEVDPDKGVVIPYEADSRFYSESWREHSGPLRFIYANQAENGLAQTLRMWPEIMDNFPGSTLTVATPCDEFVEQVQWSHSIQSELALDIRDGITQEGVLYIGRQGRKALSKAFYASDFLLFPAEPLTPSEIGSLPILQAASAGCFPVFAPVDALSELYSGMGGEAKVNDFVSLLDGYYCQNVDDFRNQAYSVAQNHKTMNIARKWSDLIVNA